MKKITLLLFTFVSLTCFSQVSYTDIIPDFIGQGNITYNIDVNNDSTDDITIFGTETTLHIDGINGGEILENGSNWAYNFVEGIPISGGNSVWSSNSQLIIDQPTGDGEWDSPVVNGFIGFRFNDAGTYRYGWIRLTVLFLSGDPNKVIWDVKDFGYETTGSSINTNQGNPLSVSSDFQLENTVIFTKGNVLNFRNLEEEANYNLYSLLGEKLKTGVISKGNSSVNIANLASGLFIIKIEGKETGSSLSRKVILK